MGTNLDAAPTIVQLLQRAVDSSTAVTIAYNGGSRPGQARSVVPVSVSKDNLVASESGSTFNKTYKLALIAWVESNGVRATNAQVAPPAAPKPPPRVVPDVPSLGSLAEYVDRYRAELAAAGWHLHEEKNSFGVATRYKNGKPKKTPSIWLRYIDLAEGSGVFDEDLNEILGEVETITSASLVLSIGGDGELASELQTERKVGPRRPPRPWRVDSWRLATGKTFPELQPAFALFIDEVRLSDPATAKGAFTRGTVS